jgi:cysteine desulfurase/selenocysteine lyase
MTHWAFWRAWSSTNSMTTREPPGGVPDEASLVEGQAPKLTDTPSVPGTTPGISLASARVVTAPTLPDLDPSMLTAAVSRLANDMFQAPQPPGAPGPAMPSAPPGVPPPAVEPALTTPPTPAAGVTPSQPTVPDASPTTDVSTPLSPFFAPLRLDDLEKSDSSWLAGIPVLDGGPQSPLEAAAPYWLMPATSEAPPPTAIPARDFQIEPLPELDRRALAGAPFDPHAVRREFPILQERVNGHRLVWLDNAATTQKPQAVIDRLSTFYERENSNVHRAAHTLAARATDAYEGARETVRRFLNAPSKSEIVFVRGTTEGINLVAQSWGRRYVQEGDEVVITWLEHHANIVPWQMLTQEKGAKLKVAPVDDTGQVILEEFEKLLGPKTRLVAFSQVSNALGTITPAREMVALAKRYGAKVLVDGAQAVSHMAVDVQQLDCDFYVFSGHKIFAPTGIGVVYGKPPILEESPPWQGGGNMIQDVRFERTIYQSPPARFEAGTGSIGDAIALGAALDWLSRLGMDNVGRYEHELLEYALERLATVRGLSFIGNPKERAGVISFVLAGQKTEEVGGLLDKEGIAVRSGHHCAQPILRRFGVEASVRASLAPYNAYDDIDALVDALRRLQAGHVAPR